MCAACLQDIDTAMEHFSALFAVDPADFADLYLDVGDLLVEQRRYDQVCHSQEAVFFSAPARLDPFPSAMFILCHSISLLSNAIHVLGNLHPQRRFDRVCRCTCHCTAYSHHRCKSLQPIFRVCGAFWSQPHHRKGADCKDYRVMLK